MTIGYWLGDVPNISHKVYKKLMCLGTVRILSCNTGKPIELVSYINKYSGVSNINKYNYGETS